MLDADQIAPGLWQGSVPPRGSILANLGFRCLVLAAEEWQIEAQAFPGVAVIHAPNSDDGSPLTREQLGIAITAARQVSARISDGQKALVTCAAGINRSGLVSALTLHFLHGWPGDKCISTVRKNRNLNGARIALSNSYFTAALRRLPAKQKEPSVRMSPGGIILP